ncbi:MAG TPA: hypothetical protein DD713_05250 [Nitrospiraceae bacterium]|nr:hypothetical protein [Nitrospiraceae bacterium]
MNLKINNKKLTIAENAPRADSRVSNKSFERRHYTCNKAFGFQQVRAHAQLAVILTNKRARHIIKNRSELGGCHKIKRDQDTNYNQAQGKGL